MAHDCTAVLIPTRRFLLAYTLLSLGVGALPLVGPHTVGWTVVGGLVLAALLISCGFAAWPGTALAQRKSATVSGNVLHVHTLRGVREINLAELHRVRHLTMYGRGGSQYFLTLIDSSGQRVVLTASDSGSAGFGRSGVVDDAVRAAILRGQQSGAVIVSRRARRALAIGDPRFGRNRILAGSAVADAAVTSVVYGVILLGLGVGGPLVYTALFNPVTW